MGTREIQALINQAQSELDAEQSTYNTEKAGIERRISEIEQAIEFNKRQAEEKKLNGGDPMEVADFENKVVTMKQELETQRNDMNMALDRKRQGINAIKSKLEQHTAKYDKAEDREQVMGFLNNLSGLM